ncbi:DUF2269 family protein [Microtetraspora malaysiensis]|uniref:DUF2269 family protein n=1 Tax=Microtetraspora malaysiensis TaxID=161358 RepID=UPI000834768E|nr:DUF2269 family protein [Microtetraspora malaysiensis]
MSLLDKVVLWLHIGFAIFAIGPLTAVTSSVPRYIRKRDVAVLRYLRRSTRLFGVLTLGVFITGLILGGSDLGAPWLSASMTLFVVAAVLMVFIERDQGAALRALSSESPKDDARVQIGRIAAMGGIAAVIWLVILFLMVFFASTR